MLLFLAVFVLIGFCFWFWFLCGDFVTAYWTVQVLYQFTLKAFQSADGHVYAQINKLTLFCNMQLNVFNDLAEAMKALDGNIKAVEHLSWMTFQPLCWPMLTLLPSSHRGCTPQNADNDCLSLTKFMRLGPLKSERYCDTMTKHSL